MFLIEPINPGKFFYFTLSLNMKGMFLNAPTVIFYLTN